MIKAPFNFVPLNEVPYFPDWADQISHDMPFKDGLSGKIRLRIIAETPIFITDMVQEDNTVPCEFCHISDSIGRKQYFIPGTSIKGMIRNVLEIISFGKLTQVQNQSFGIRDLSNGADGTFYRAKVKVDKVHCGWLRMDKDGYLLKDCGLPWRISAEEIDRKFKMGLMDFIREKQNFKSDENKTARKKYSLFNLHADSSLLTDYFESTTISGINAGGRKFVRFDAGGVEGTIVFTGQPGIRQKRYNEKKNKYVSTGKLFEFVFPLQVEKSNINVPEKVFREFESIHQNSSDYTDFRRKQLRRGEEIPVFFIYNEDGEVDSMGISYMYKYPAYNKVYNGIPITLLSKAKKDLCESIFGYTDKNFSLKGRVQFLAAHLRGEPSILNDVTLALAKPHPSYYPLYLGKGQTWNTENIRIAGRKRYPVRQSDDILINVGTDKMRRIIRPMNEGSIFEGDVMFFNLRPIELGALLSAIDFCQHEECSHNIGQGKPLGYGKVKLTVVDSKIECVDADSPCSFSQARDAFISEMEKHFPGWAMSSQLKELFAMAKGIPMEKASQFKYMEMSTTNDDNEFKQGLKDYAQGEQLGSFTQIMSGNVPNIKQKANVSIGVKREDMELLLNKETELAIAKADETRKQEEYSNFIQQAKLYYHEDKVEDALACLEKASAIYPDRAEVSQMIAECQNAKKNAEFLQHEQEKAQEKLMRPLAEVIQKITKANNLVSKTTQWLNVEGHSLGGQELSAFLDVAKRLPSKEKKKLPNRISEIAQLLSKEQADVLSKELETI